LPLGALRAQTVTAPRCGDLPSAGILLAHAATSACRTPVSVRNCVDVHERRAGLEGLVRVDLLLRGDGDGGVVGFFRNGAGNCDRDDDGWGNGQISSTR
jgi:hypothetical protein